MRTVFLGTDYYSTIALTTLLDSPSNISIELVVTSPKKPSFPFAYESVREIADRHNIPTILIESKDELFQSREQIKSFDLDLGFVYSFGYLIPEEIFSIPRHNIVNLHPSLLPKYRGVSPMPQAILDGKAETGVTLIEINSSFDAGDILLQLTEPISPDDTTLTLAKRLITRGTHGFSDLVNQYPSGEWPKKAQAVSEDPHTKTYSTQDAYIAFSEDIVLIDRKIRAYYPKPIAWTYLSKVIMHFSAKQDLPESWESKRVQLLGSEITAGELKITTLKIEGKQEISWKQFAQGYLS